MGGGRAQQCQALGEDQQLPCSSPGQGSRGPGSNRSFPGLSLSCTWAFPCSATQRAPLVVPKHSAEKEKAPQAQAGGRQRGASVTKSRALLRPSTVPERKGQLCDPEHVPCLQGSIAPSRAGAPAPGESPRPQRLAVPFEQRQWVPSPQEQGRQQGQRGV